MSSTGAGSNVDPVTALAVALEQLAVRVSRDLDVDAGEGVPPEDPLWAETIAGLVEYARECAEILDEPEIAAALGAHAANQH